MAPRHVLVAAAALVLSGFAALHQPHAAAQPPAAAPTSPRSSIAWQDCGDGFECAEVAVPLDYDKPRGSTISLSVLRLPASNPSQRIGSLFVNPGGPGISGVQFTRAAAGFTPQELRERFDIVSFDPRGVAGSTPLRCFRTYADSLANRPAEPFPLTRAEEREQRAADRRLSRACARHAGPILGHMSTADVARDMDALRRMVGDRQLTYLGYSYGSVIGQTYANLFPGRVRALVIDGVIDPIAWTTGRGNEGRRLPSSTRTRSDIGAQATLDEYFRLCDQAGPGCAFSGDAQQRFAAVAAQLRQHPAPYVDPLTGVAGEITYNGLIAFTLDVLYQPAAWSDAARLFADLERQISPSALGRRMAAVERMTSVPQEPYQNDVEGAPGVACSDSTNPRSFRAWPRAADAAERQHGYFGRIWTWASSPCASWPRAAGQDRYQGPWTARTANPVLIVGNYFDPATRYEGAVTAARLLPNSRLLSYAGPGHTAFLNVRSSCIDEKVTTYLITKQTPPAGTVCAPVGSPFDPAPAAPTAVRVTSTRAHWSATRGDTSVSR